jgi:hypothetical protein
MAVALAHYYQSSKQIQLSSLLHLADWQESLIGRAPEQSSTAVEVPLISNIPESALIPPKEEALERDLKFEIAYHALADRRGANATPAGRTLSRRVWLDAGEDAAKWLIDRLQTEQHTETLIGIAETITELGAVALPIALAELERYKEAKPEFAALVEALAWIKPPRQPQLLSRIASIVDRYLESPQIDCQVAAIQLTRILNDNEARTRLNAAKKNAGQRLREEIEDLLNERFDE